MDITVNTLDEYTTFFNSANQNWQPDVEHNLLFLKAVQAHMNNWLAIQGHVFLNDVYDALRLPRTAQGAVVGWVYNGAGDGFIDFGATTHGAGAGEIKLTFNVDGVILEHLPEDL
jgi:hypothetical protein